MATPILTLPGVPGTRAMLFDENSTDEYSAVFHVPYDGGGVLLTVFNIGNFPRVGTQPAKAQTVFIQRVVPRQYGMPTGESNCDPDIFVQPEFEIEWQTCVKQCGAWCLQENHNMGIISVPGTYRAFLQDKSMLGTVSLEALRLGPKSLAVIPDDLYFGKV